MRCHFLLLAYAQDVVANMQIKTATTGEAARKHARRMSALVGEQISKELTGSGVIALVRKHSFSPTAVQIRAKRKQKQTVFSANADHISCGSL